MNYYIISFTIYLLTLAAFILVLKKPEKAESAKFKDKFNKEMVKGLTKSDVKARKKRVKVLPLFHRFLYWLWFFATISFIFITPIALYVSNVPIIKALFVPDSAIHISPNGVNEFVLAFGGLLLGVVISVGFSYLTYTKTIRRADSHYQKGSFQEYPKEANCFICFILVLVVFPAVVMSFNSYTYCTNEEIVIKPVFSFSERVYTYSEIVYIEQKFYSDGDFSYFAHTDSGKKLDIYTGPGNPELADAFQTHNLEITENIVISPIDYLLDKLLPQPT